MQPFVTDGVATVAVCLSVGLSVCHSVNPAKRRNRLPLEMPFGLWARLSPRNHLLAEPALIKGERALAQGSTLRNRCVTCSGFLVIFI